MNRIYIAGPMRGKPYYNFGEFDLARDGLLNAGLEPVSPADIDRESGFDPYKIVWPENWKWDTPPQLRLPEVMDRDIDALKTCDGIYMLRGWEQSNGAKAEKAIAEWLGLHVTYQTGAEADPNGKSAHDKGSKLDAGKTRVELVLEGFPRALMAVAEVSTFGAKKYTDGGWIEVPDGRRRYTGALGRHLLKEPFELNDKDSGLAHDAHAAWNALARLELRLIGK